MATDLYPVRIGPGVVGDVDHPHRQPKDALLDLMHGIET